jgi:UDP-glucose 4-epimerase
VLNVCTGIATTIVDLANTIAGIWGQTPVIDFAPRRDGDIRASIGDAKQALTQLGFAAQTPIAAGLTHTAQFIRLPPPVSTPSLTTDRDVR